MRGETNPKPQKEALLLPLPDAGAEEALLIPDVTEGGSGLL
jgi:hypothetical protein